MCESVEQLLGPAYIGIGFAELDWRKAPTTTRFPYGSVRPPRPRESETSPYETASNTLGDPSRPIDRYDCRCPAAAGRRARRYLGRPIHGCAAVGDGPALRG